MASVSNTIAKYLLSAYELRRAGQRGGENAPPWENKSMWVFYIELTTDFLKLTTYLAFFSVIITFYGLPLNIIRDVYITARSLYTRLHALHRYQIATRNMDQRYPNATEEELATMSDRTCIICREEMVAPAQAGDAQQAPAPQSDGPNMTPKKLPCGHIFHFHCLRSWLERQQSCPTCRRTVLDNNNPPGQVPAGQAPAQGAQQQQQPNPFGGARAQNPNGVPRNDVGLLGRLLGNQNQPPAAPRRPAALPTQGNLGPPNVTNDATGRVVIQYNINYQVPLRQETPNEGQAPPQPHPQLRPVPPFLGFEGPGNTWQQWPTNNQGQNPAPDGQNPSANASGTSQSPSDSQPSSSPTGNGDSATTATDTRNPREEAAQAALRRFNSPNAPNETAGRTPAQGDSPAPTQTIPEPQRQPFDVPGLIPLYEFNLDTPRPTNEATSIPLSIREPASLPSGSHSQAPIREDLFGGLPASGTRVSSSAPLPSSLTDEQLSVLDKTTREAIDERLRVLERVSASVHHNIEDLLRMRSVLPLAPIATATGFNGPVGNATRVDGHGLTDATTSPTHATNEARDPQPSGSGA
ncbi:E3 ubiquitin-protein ligase hrd1 [Marasmius tenuissimus]|uniref:RING-type E3 ubiquitin transferase n=1 Tax=Marasmius tenuissimus TaxID=585030 RepID=A0ABR3AFU9_9AGAR